MRPSNRADGQVGGVIAGSTIPPVNHSLTATRNAMIKKAALSITDITGEVSSSSASEETVVTAIEETLTSGSPLESPHKMVQGNPDSSIPPEENPRDMMCWNPFSINKNPHMMM